MTWNRRVPDAPSPKAVRAAFDAFAPLDRDVKMPEKPKRQKRGDDELPEFGEKDPT